MKTVVLALTLLAACGQATAENRLASEASPYLRSHASNPVDWWPWGDAAFAKAKAEGKPVLLSVGYEACHWCHVMARESFADAGVATALERFVCIKVDREELPEVDRVYLGFVAAQTGRAGWPLTVFLAPDRTPLLGGTYFPRERFLEVLDIVHGAWTSDREGLQKRGAAVLASLAPAAPAAPGDAEPIVAGAVEALRTSFDALDGGFGAAPKFPLPGPLSLLVREAQRPEARTMLARTLRAIADGGIADHLGGGFHRYAVDAAWRVPHFEKMLYDQALLARAMVEGWRLLGDERLRDSGADALRYALRDLRLADGSFAASEGADSAPAEGQPHREGAFYVWTAAELDAALASLGPDAVRLAHAALAVRDQGNVPEALDPHGELAGRNVLRLDFEPAALAVQLGIDERVARELLARCRETLGAARAQRPRPTRVEQRVMGWNGLMIGTLAVAAAEGAARDAAERDAWLAAARAAATAMLAAWDEERGLPRIAPPARSAPATWRAAGASDYAQLIDGLIELHAADGDARWLERALALQARLDRDFLDPATGTWFDAPADPDLPLRLREDEDGVEPAANSVAAWNLMRLATITGDDGLAARRDRLLTAYRGLLATRPWAMPAMAAVLAVDARSLPRLHVAGPEADAATRSLLDASRRGWRPRLVRVRYLRAEGGALAAFPMLSVGPVGGASAAHLCVGEACHPPCTTPEALTTLLDRVAPVP